MGYEVRLEVFEGPIDLLLHLITRQRVDIYDISLSGITEEYLAAVAELEPLDLETATGFLVVASTLLELKSARLLPGHAWDEADARLLEERDLLLARLVECSTYRAAGAWIRAALDEGSLFHGRSAALEERYIGLAPDLLARVRLEDLARVAATALRQRPVPVLDTSHVAPIRASVRDAILIVSQRLQGAKELGFEELCRGTGERLEVIVRFLALLELFKAGAIELGQSDRFGDIRARWTGETDATAAAAEAEEYALEEER